MFTLVNRIIGEGKLLSVLDREVALFGFSGNKVIVSLSNINLFLELISGWCSNAVFCLAPAA